MFFPKPKRRSSKVVTVPAPTGGLNARDSLAAMPETDAIVMRNIWPQPYGCTPRKGSFKSTTGFSNPPETLATWSGFSGAIKRFAWSGSDMFDITTPGAIGTALLTGLSNARWQYASISSSGGSFLLAANGVDDMIGYKAAGVYRIVAGNGTDPNTWSGIDPKKIVQLTVHQGRVWGVEIDTAKAWYLPVGQIQGTLVSFDFGPLFINGGFLQYLSTWTIDDGNGAEDHLVAMSSQGDIVVYSGTDPSNSAAWSLSGVYYAGPPVSGRRSYAKVAGDLVIITQRGVVSLTSLLVSTKVSDSAVIFKSSKIQLLVSYATATFADLFGWQLIYVAPYNMLIVNVPTNEPAGCFQFVANELMPNEPWTIFNGWDARSWMVSDNLLYFGSGSNDVLKAWSGTRDNTTASDVGTEIIWEVQQAYSYVGAFSVQKQIGMYRPNFITEGDISYNAHINYDFQTDTITAPSPPAPDSSASWGSALWGVALWGGTIGTDRSWNQGLGIGVAASLHISGQAGVEFTWVSTDYSYKAGGLL